MLTKDAVNFFGNKNQIRQILNYSSTGAVYRWGRVVPARAAMKLHVFSGKRIPLRLTDYSDSDSRIPNDCQERNAAPALSAAANEIESGGIQ